MNIGFLRKSSDRKRETMHRNAFHLLCLMAFLLPFSALAESIDEYCLTKTGERTEKDFTGQADPNFKVVTLNFSSGGKKYNLISGIHHIGLFDEQNKLIKTYDARQKQGRIENIEIKGNTLNIEGGTDYQAFIDINVSPPKITSAQEIVNLDFTAGGRSYKLVADSNQVILQDDQKNRISVLGMDQYSEDGIFPHISINELALSKNGWLWVNGNKNYVAHIDLNATPPTIGNPLELSELTNTKCLPLTWLGKCRSTQGVYSHALDGILVSSTKRSFFGLFPPVSFLVKDGKPIPLPKELNDIRREDTGYGSQYIFFFDVPKLNGVFFRGSDGQPIFYDGERTKWLPLPRIFLGDTNYWHLSSSRFNKQAIIEVSLRNPKSKHLGKKLFFQINSDLSITQILATDDFTDNWRKVDTFWLGLHGIYIQDGNTLRPVISVPKSINLNNNGYANEYIAADSDDKAIAFQATNIKTQKSTHYFITRASSNIQCIATLNPDNPIVLNE